MNNTTLILILALGGVAVFALTRKPEIIRETETIETERKLTDAEKAGGWIGQGLSYLGFEINS